MMGLFLIQHSLGTLELSKLYELAAVYDNKNLLYAAGICILVGFGAKAGMFPLHIWLPKAHPAAPSHVSALMSGVMLKIALYGFGRFMFSFLPAWNYWWCVAVLLAGVVSAFLGVLYAQMETDIKRVLAYSSVENMGVIFAAFGCGMLMKASGSSFYMLGFVAALVHAFNHSIMMVLMFMCHMMKIT